jgi:hypothetical protein
MPEAPAEVTSSTSALAVSSAFFWRMDFDTRSVSEAPIDRSLVAFLSFMGAPPAEPAWTRLPPSRSVVQAGSVMGCASPLSSRRLRGGIPPSVGTNGSSAACVVTGVAASACSIRFLRGGILASITTNGWCPESGMARTRASTTPESTLSPATEDFSLLAIILNPSA